MCRLFALHAGRRDVRAEFWLLEAPTSLAVQSEVNADGFGIAALSADDALLLIRNPVQASSLQESSVGLGAPHASGPNHAAITVSNVAVPGVHVLAVAVPVQVAT